MTDLLKREEKFGLITDNYINGNRKDAAKGIRKLTRIEIANLFAHMDYFTSFRGEQKIQFQGFIMSALESEI